MKKNNVLTVGLCIASVFIGCTTMLAQNGSQVDEPLLRVFEDQYYISDWYNGLITGNIKNYTQKIIDKLNRSNLMKTYNSGGQKKFILDTVLNGNKEQPVLKYDFGPGEAAPGYIRVNASDKYTNARGYGLFGESKIVGVNRKGKDALKEDFVTSDKPFYFQTDLEEGNYEVTVILGDRKGISENTIKAESRRLMVEDLKTKKGEIVTQTFMVNVRNPRIGLNDSIHRKSREMGFLNWDNKLTLEFNGPKPCIDAVEIKKVNCVINVFLAGNSTVVDQEYEPWASWGQMIPRFFTKEVVVANYAESGETLKAFQREKRLKKILSLMKKGDYLFIEFAHNDQKPGGNHVDPFTTYKEELNHFIQGARERGGIPVLVTSINRRSFNQNGKIVNTLGDYPEAMRQLSKEEHVDLIDLNAMSKTLFEAMGEEGTTKAFVHFPAGSFPGQTKALADNTHFNNYGAYELAKCVVEGIKKSNLALKNYLKEVPDFDPGHPDPFDKFDVPYSPSISQIKPDGN